MVRFRVLTTGMKRLKSTQTTAAHPSAAPQSEYQGGLWGRFKESATAVGVYFTILLSCCGVAAYAQHSIDTTKAELKLAKEKIKTAEQKIKTSEANTAKEVAKAELRVAEKFLMLGFVEEYSNYQQKFLPGKIKVFLILDFSRFDSALSHILLIFLCARKQARSHEASEDKLSPSRRFFNRLEFCCAERPSD